MSDFFCNSELIPSRRISEDWDFKYVWFLDNLPEKRSGHLDKTQVEALNCEQSQISLYIEVITLFFLMDAELLNSEISSQDSMDKLKSRVVNCQNWRIDKTHTLAPKFLKKKNPRIHC